MKKNLFKILTAAAFVALITLLIFSIIKTLSPTPANLISPSDNSLRIITNINTENPECSNLLTCIDSYSEADVECTFYSGDNFTTRVQVDFASSNSPDIIIASPDRNIKKLYHSGKLAELTPALASNPEWYDTFDKSALNLTTEDGKIYALPLETEYIAMYINENILGKLGISAPKTFEELKNTVNIVKSHGYVPIAFSANDKEMLLYQAILSSAAGYFGIQDSINEQNYEYSTKALSYMKELYDLGAFPDNYFEIEQSDARKLFLYDKAAFIVETSDFAEYIKNFNYSKSSSLEPTSLNPEDYSITVFPAINPIATKYKSRTVDSEIIMAPLPYGAGNMTVFVSSMAYREKYSTVLSFLKYITSEKTLNKLYLNTSFMPAVNHSTFIHKRNKLILERDMLINYCTEFTSMPHEIFNKYVWYNVIFPNISRLFDNQISSDEIIQLATEKEKLLLVSTD